LCETFEAEIAFVLADDDGRPGLVGAYGLPSEDVERLLGHGLLDASIASPQRVEGVDLLGVGARALVCAP